MSTTKKDTVYIEADDEITLVIDKVISSKERVVALVLPKRAAVFQSAVNMKLLKKTSSQAKKSLVLISSDAAITNMAALSKLHIAKTLNSKPVIPKIVEAEADATIAADELTSAAATVTPQQVKEQTDTDESAAADATNEEETVAVESKTTDKVDASITVDNKKKMLKIPDFSSFRFKMGLVGLLVSGIIVSWIFGFVILPKATVTITTNIDRIDVSSEFSVSADLVESSIADEQLRATRVQTSKEEQVTIKATGEKNTGDKASGTMTITNCIQSSGGTSVPAGSVFASNNRSFVTLAKVDLGPAIFVGSDCRSDDFPAFGAVKDVAVEAVEAGEEFNLSAQSYQSAITGVFGFGSDMSGGTTEVTVVVTQADLDNAINQLTGSGAASARDELASQLAEQQLTVLEDTFVESDPVTKRSAEVDEEATDVVVTRTVNYSMLGVVSSDIIQLLEEAAKSQLTSDGQNIRSAGADDANFSVKEKVSNTEYEFSIRTVATIGPEFDEAAIKQEVAGQKRGDIENLLEARQGVRSVEVEYKPFWVFSTPGSAEKIEIVIKEES